MIYYIVYNDGNTSIVLESFRSREMADRFLKTMRFWFSKPFQLVEVLTNGEVVKPAE